MLSWRAGCQHVWFMKQTDDGCFFCTTSAPPTSAHAALPLLQTSPAASAGGLRAPLLVAARKLQCLPAGGLADGQDGIRARPEGHRGHAAERPEPCGLLRRRHAERGGAGGRSARRRRRRAIRPVRPLCPARVRRRRRPGRLGWPGRLGRPPDHVDGGVRQDDGCQRGARRRAGQRRGRRGRPVVG